MPLLVGVLNEPGSHCAGLVEPAFLARRECRLGCQAADRRGTRNVDLEPCEMRSVAVVARSKPDPEDVAIERLGEWHGRVALHPRLLAGGLEYPAELAPAHSNAPQPVARHFRLLRRRSGQDRKSTRLNPSH